MLVVEPSSDVTHQTFRPAELGFANAMLINAARVLAVALSVKPVASSGFSFLLIKILGLQMQ